MNKSNLPPPPVSQPSIKVGNQYKKIYWQRIVLVYSVLVLAFIVVSLPMMPSRDAEPMYIIIIFPLLILVDLRYYGSVRKRMICPVCSRGKLELQTLDQIDEHVLVFSCPVCEQNYTSDLKYKKQLISTQPYFSVIKQK